MTREGLIPYLGFDRTADASFYQQIYDGVRGAILEGRLRPRQRLPSTRELARDLGISRLPVLNAFDQLLHEGYVEGRAGSGTYVTASIPSLARRDRDPGARSRRDAANLDSLLGPFRVSLPALDQFPSRTWARLVSRHARRMPIELMAYGDPAGHFPLRQAIADYLRTARAVVCEADQVLVVSGSQMALQLCAMTLLAPGDDVCVEEPGYPGARAALTTFGATLRPVPVDDEGLQVRAMPTNRGRARVAYVTPSHQYPLGMSMSASRRLELLDWARRQRAWIIEDDYDSEYRFASRPLASLQGMAPESRVIYVGTFSKVLFPSLRIGYLVVPRSLTRAFAQHRETLDIFSPTLYQAVLRDFIVQGHFARHVRRMRAVYHARRDALVAGLERLHPALAVVNSEAGMHLTARLTSGIDDREVVRRAAAGGISATALSSCYAGKQAGSGLVLGFGGADEAAIARGLDTLTEILREMSGDTR